MGYISKGEVSKMHAVFSAAGRRVEGEFAVYPDQFLFKAGDYPDQKIAVSPEEMAAAVAAFAPISGNIEHTEFLKGRAIFVDSVKVDDADPWNLRGDVRIPLWLDEQLGAREKKVSAEWDRTSKTLVGMALCVTPQIPEADLMASFKKHHSYHGKRVMQGIHDMASSSGAYCVDPPGDTANVNAAFIMRHERGSLQKIHDHAVESGAACHGSAMFRSRSPKKGKPMGLLAKITRLLGQAPAEDQLTDDEVKSLFTKISGPEKVAEAPVVEKPAEVPATEVADFKKDPEFVRLQRENATFKARVLQADASEWADAEIKARRALITEKPKMVAMFAQASLDDEADAGLARFSEGSKAVAASRVEVIKATFAARPAHMLYEEFLENPPADDAEATAPRLLQMPALASFTAAKKADPKEVAELRKHSTILRGVDAPKKS